ncbi:MAG TPA: TrbG/VirB9 family P-type conjugative transfer protein [Thermoanaerobaculia bacterium]|nr:TrbG/VirB9 family P-type conjugative transfer protein [Thermoanaerobaculia bacterium]
MKPRSLLVALLPLFLSMAAAAAVTPTAFSVNGVAAPLEDPAVVATRAFRNGEPAKTIETAAYTLVPFGQAQPRLRCAPLRVCLIELEAGESVLSTLAGDTERWAIQATLGGTDGKTPLLAVKPQACDLATNLAILTTKRIYDLELSSPPCGKGENAQLPYTRRLRFYYPEDLVRRWQSDETHEAAAAEDPSAVALSPALPLESLNFSYRWRKDRGYPWTPEQIFDDGAHVYIRLSERARDHEAPLLFVLRDGKATDLLNYAIRGDYYVTDRIFDRAVLVVGSGRDKRELEIENRRGTR